MQRSSVVMIFVSQTEEGGEIRWRDSKRYLWLLSLAMPAVPLVAALMLLNGGNPLWSALILAVGFGLIPILDIVFGEDSNNPPDAVVEELSADPWYRRLLFASLPIYYASFFAAAYVIATVSLPLWAYLLLAIGAGANSGAGLTIAHELGHKSNRLDQLGAKVMLALTGYAHFCIEHNRGHHVLVATASDPASAKLGESVYEFATREIPGTLRLGWHHERERLSRKGLAFWHWRNDLLQGFALTLLIAALLLGAFGWIMLPFLIIHHGVGWLQLTLANYIEHYGLLRQTLDNGRPEACTPKHSWNTNHIVSNLMLFHLQRHSDHHANPLRPYQALRNFAELPRLPSGYPGCYLLALLPPLWFRIMDPKVMAWAGGDIAKVNRVDGVLAA
jgi:alkane 1-monooxygenase